MASRLALLMSLLAFDPTTSQAPGAFQVSQREVNLAKYMMSARFESGASNCGGGVVDNGWQLAVEQYWERDINPNTAEMEQYWERDINPNTAEKMATEGGFFNTTTGRFRAPIEGVYHISGFARCETQGCDITIRANFDRVAGFGTDLVDQLEGNEGNTQGCWSSHGVATSAFLRRDQEVYLRYESGNGNPPSNNATSGDCIVGSIFLYGQLNIVLYLPTELKDDLTG